MDQNILARFTNKQGLVDVLFEIGVGENEREKIVGDGFDSMLTLVNKYEHDVEVLVTYLKQINKTFGSVANIKASRRTTTVSCLLQLLCYPLT